MAGRPEHAGERLDAANAILPGRVNLTELGPPLDAALGEGRRRGSAGKRRRPGLPRPDDRLPRAGHRRPLPGARRRRRGGRVHRHLSGRHRRRDDDQYKGERLPEFGVTGVWPLIPPRARARASSAWSTTCRPTPATASSRCSAYQYAGGITYNAFHNAGVRCELGSTPFLPTQWRRVVGRARTEEAVPEPLDRQPRARRRTAARASPPAT